MTVHECCDQFQLYNSHVIGELDWFIFMIVLHKRLLHVEHSYKINSCNYHFHRKQHNIDFHEKKSVEYSSFDYPFSERTSPQRDDNS